MVTKTCSKCGIPKELEHYNIASSGKYGRSAVCKVCKRKIDSEYRATHKEEIASKFKVYYKENREKRIKSSVAWKKKNPERGKANADRWRENNRESDRKSKLDYYYRNPNYIAEWRSRNPYKRRQYWESRRARKLGADLGDVTSESISQLFEYYGNRCLRCNRTDLPLTVDHIVPLSVGGTHSMDNLQPLCGSCNSKKYMSTIDYRPCVWEQL